MSDVSNKKKCNLKVLLKELKIMRGQQEKKKDRNRSR
jgi:hypothetical protein